MRTLFLLTLALALLFVFALSAHAEEPQPEPVIGEVVAQFPRLWLPIIGSLLPDNVGFSCSYLAENPTVVPDLMRRWGVPESQIPATVTCDSLQARQLDTLIVRFTGNPTGWWCVAAIRLNIGAAILYWHQDPPVGPPATAGYECKDVNNGCYWIAMGRPDRNSRITDVMVRGNMPTRAFATCFPAP